MPSEAIIDALRNRARKFFSLDAPADADMADTAVDVGAGFVPGVGTALSARDFERARREGDALGMGLSVAGMVPVVGGVARAANTARKGVNATEETIKALRSTPDFQSIVRPGNPIQGAVVLIGDKMYMGRTHGDALNRAVYEGAVRKEGGKFIYPKDAEVDMDLFMTQDGRIIDRLTAYKELDTGAAETAIEKGLMQNNPARSMTVNSYMEQAKALRDKRKNNP
jgi:hypothetical protein